MISTIIDNILSAPAWAVYVVVGALVFAEDALFVGFVLPGETAAILGGAAASRGHVSLTAVLVIVIGAAIVGDSVGYEVGRHLGSRLLDHRAFAKRRAQLQDAQDFLARRGGTAVMLGRGVAFFRAVMPALAGTAKMPYRRFLTFNAIGGAVWGTAVVLLGYVAGNSYKKIESAFGRDAAVVVVVVVLVGLVVRHIRHIRRRRREDADRIPG